MSKESYKDRMEKAINSLQNDLKGIRTGRANASILDGVKGKLLEGFRNEEEFGYMAGYEPWEKLIFDR